MSKNKKTTLLIVGILLVISVITGISYALWSITRTQEDPNKIASGCFSLEMVDGDVLELTNEFPLRDADGLQTEPYTFEIKNTCTIAAKVTIKLLVTNETTMSLNAVKANLSGGTTMTPTIVGNLSDGTTVTPNISATKIMKNINIPGNTTKSFDLRLWMDEAVTIGQEENKEFKGKIEIEALATEAYADESGANAPELNNGLIPVVYNDTTKIWEIADTYSEWYNYNEQKWANAVTVKQSVRSKYTSMSPGMQVPMDDINTMWVWIPRYSYTIKSEDGTHYYGNLNGNVTYCKDIESPDRATYPSCYEYEIDATNKAEFQQYLINEYDFTESDAKEFTGILYRDKYESGWAGYSLKEWLDEAGVTYQETFKGENIANYSIVQPAAIDIKFANGVAKESGTAQYTGNTANSWLTNPAFTFGTQELTGMWVAKFEVSPATGTTCATTSDLANCDITTFAPEIKPNVSSWRNARVGTFFTAIQSQMNGNNGTTTYGITNSDTHMMKNMEWGAVAYLSQSRYGKYSSPSYTGENKEVAINNCGKYITGIGGDTIGANWSSTTCTTNTYETEKGQAASTTGNIYGIYDVSGGAWEYVMGVMKESTNSEVAVGNSTSSNSGFSGKVYDFSSAKWIDYTGIYGSLKDIDTKYYDQYTYYEDTTGLGLNHSRGMLGEATKETYGWYQDLAYFVGKDYPWFVRGGSYTYGIIAGIFEYEFSDGYSNDSISTRAVLVPAAR